MHVQMHPRWCAGSGKVGIRVKDVRSGTPATELDGVNWRKSSRSGALGNCVELAWLPDQMAVRNSRDPHGPVLTYSIAELQTFVSQVRAKGF
jgi:uncharacterized protein DUF397